MTIPLMGFTITESTACLTFETVERTWKERLFTKPWSPFRKTKMVGIPAMARMDNHIICHPAMMTELRELIKRAP